MKQDIFNFARRLFGQYESSIVPEFQSRSFGPDVLERTVEKIAGGTRNLLEVREEGRSVENRAISLIAAGSGNLRILLWSQMHGDESTATMAICDILNFISRNRSDGHVDTILKNLNLNFIPMLNPDGAARFQRRNAVGIDLNRDALAFASPEAGALKAMHVKLKPAYAFNLHDQELSSVALSRELSAIGLLAPAFDPSKSDNPTRDEAKRLASTFGETMKLFVPGKVTKYDDSFEPRAFGDNMQKWGTSTLLVESGHVRDDEQKSFIRKLNFVGLLTSIFAIAGGALKEFGAGEYESLPFNGKRAYDVVIRNIKVGWETGQKTGADLALSSQVDTHSEPPLRLVEIGDLSGHVGLREIDGNLRVVPAGSLRLNGPFDLDQFAGKK